MRHAVLCAPCVSSQMRLRIFVRMELLDEVTDVEAGAENTGLGHVIANKGGQAIKFVLRGTSFVFVSSHLAAHESAAKCQRRNEDVAEIFHGIRFGNKKYDFLQFDHVFWNGDLNYRIEVPPAALKTAVSGNGKFETPRALVMDLVEKRNYGALWEMDELQREMKAGRVFANFRTPRANFKPTFKVMRTNGGANGQATTYNPKRIPSYCDRIVWSSSRHLLALDAGTSAARALGGAVQCESLRSFPADKGQHESNQIISNRIGSCKQRRRSIYATRHGLFALLSLFGYGFAPAPLLSRALTREQTCRVPHESIKATATRAATRSRRAITSRSSAASP